MVLQDIERQRVAMQALREHPGVSAEALDAMFQNLQQVAEPLAEQGRIAEELRDNDWLQSLRGRLTVPGCFAQRSEEHTSELQSRGHLVCRLLLEKKNILMRQLLACRF